MGRAAKGPVKKKKTKVVDLPADTLAIVCHEALHLDLGLEKRRREGVLGRGPFSHGIHFLCDVTGSMMLLACTQACCVWPWLRLLCCAFLSVQVQRLRCHTVLWLRMSSMMASVFSGSFFPGLLLDACDDTGGVLRVFAYLPCMLLSPGYVVLRPGLRVQGKRPRD